jgi:hypothetical protein
MINTLDRRPRVAVRADSNALLRLFCRVGQVHKAVYRFPATMPKI